MRAGGGKSKGNAFEREVCKRLSLWATRGKRDDVLWRSAISGGRATVHAKKGKSLAHVAGDICGVHPDADPFVSRFYAECKFYRDLKVPALFYTGDGTLAAFWNETVKQAQRHGKAPMLIFKQNLYKPMVGMQSGDFDRLGIYASAIITELDFNVCTFEAFLKHAVSPAPLPKERPKLLRKVVLRGGKADGKEIAVSRDTGGIRIPTMGPGGFGQIDYRPTGEKEGGREVWRIYSPK